MNLMKLRNFKVVKLELIFTTLEFLKFIQFVITCDFNSTDPPNELSLVVSGPAMAMCKQPYRTGPHNLWGLN
jgi:hypothetical protein